MPTKRTSKSFAIAPAEDYEVYAAGAQTYTGTAQSVLTITTGDVELVKLDGTTGDLLPAVSAYTVLLIQANGTGANTTAQTAPLYSEE